MAYEVVVYGRPDNVCMKCRATKRWLARHGIPYRAVNIDKDAEGEAYVRELGALAVPVVVVLDGPSGDEWWSDHRVNRLADLAEGLRLDDSA